jgi:uncharacterized membrane protein YdjX (TVP38/TMEM64 family)
MLAPTMEARGGPGRGRAPRLLAGAALLLALFAAARRFPLEEAARQLRERIHELGPLGWLAFVGLYVLATLLLVPGVPLTLTAGPLFGLARGMLAVWTAAMVTTAVAFAVGRHGARARVEAHVRSRPRLRAIDAAIAEGGWRVVLLLRLSPLVPFSLSNYLYGVTPVRAGPYLAATAAGMVPGIVVYTYIGWVAGARLEGRERSPLEWGLLALGLVATLAASALLTRLARRKLATVAAVREGEEA